MAGLLLVALALPSGGCLSGLLCSEYCFGSIDCRRYDASACPAHAGCSVTNGLCAGAESCDIYESAQACNAEVSCKWEKNCC